MEKVKPGVPQGTRDFGPLMVQKRKYIIQHIEEVFRKYGFMPLETPAMEKLQTLTGKYGEEGDRLLFKIVNSGDAFSEIRKTHAEMRVADLPFRVQDISEKGLRYDLTVPFARFVAMNHHALAMPFRRYQIQPVWRADRPQKGRYREFWQCDADIVGSKSLYCELDLLCIYHEAFLRLGIKDYLIKINNRKILAGIAQVVKGEEHLETIAVCIDKLDKIGKEGVQKELGERGFNENEIQQLFDIIFTENHEVAQLQLLRNKLSSSPIAMEGIEEMEFVLTQLQQSGHSIQVQMDISLARGLGYYTGTIAEVIVNNPESPIQSSIGGGGRYDNLTGVFGLDGVAGIGISFGLDRIYDVMEGMQLFPDNLKETSTQVVFCYFDEASKSHAWQGVIAVRKAGIAAELYPDTVKKIGKQLDYASKLQIPYAAICGNDEVHSNTYMVKDLNIGSQQSMNIQTLIDTLR